MIIKKMDDFEQNTKSDERERERERWRTDDDGTGNSIKEGRIRLILIITLIAAARVDRIQRGTLHR